MAIELRRKTDDTVVKAGDTLTHKDGYEIEVLYVCHPSFKHGAASIKGTNGTLYLPSEVGCYATTV